ncbi:penicillin-insensitive murein endopeptidase [Sinorhizobium sp. BG8]|uniref:penicillin-insensitive murein endopeptidase n=1 Tax=Sinorhizobium sp. BG8 TaxID=2613773 RepID=UPI001FEDD15C|nr:penicillin-insensitive murein endopeptidase [Sinorhizobium sp. BG8]
MALLAVAEPLAAAGDTPAKELFGGMRLPAKMAPAPLGFYAKGCLAGGVAIPTDGPTWQAMRLSRNRRWGHPQMVALIEQFSRDAREKIGWNGLLLGDISQPRGGPMLNGHASHQIGLDADIWLTQMPKRTFSYQEREDIQATSMLQKNKFLTVDPSIWTPEHARLIMLAASYPQVERVFVNPAIKKKLCDTWGGNRALLGKVRPIYGHDYHFHIRIKCPEGSTNCKSQAAVPAGDGCDKSLAWWFTKEPWAKPKPNAKPVKPRYLTLADLPKACSVVLRGQSADSEADATFGAAPTAAAFSSESSDNPGSVEAAIEAAGQGISGKAIPVPVARPASQ